MLSMQAFSKPLGPAIVQDTSGMLVDTSCTPYVPEGVYIHTHLTRGLQMLSNRCTYLHLHDGLPQFGGELYASLVKLPVCNAVVLDTLLANPNLLARSWLAQAKLPIRINFPGTLYGFQGVYGESLYVRYLEWSPESVSHGFKCTRRVWAHNEYMLVHTCP